MVLLNFKQGTVVRLLDTALIPGLVALLTFMESILDITEITVTSVNEGRHMSGSLHYQGRALDIRSKIYEPEKVAKVVAEFKQFYDRDYDLIWEAQGEPNEHLHLQYNPRS